MCSVAFQYRCMAPKPARKRRRQIDEWLWRLCRENTSFLCGPTLLMLGNTAQSRGWKWNSLGRFPVYQTSLTHTLYSNASTSFSSTTSPDWELWSLLVCISTSNIRQSFCGDGLLLWEPPLELLCSDSCWASGSIFSMSPLWMEN